MIVVKIFLILIVLITMAAVIMTLIDCIKDKEFVFALLMVISMLLCMLLILVILAMGQEPVTTTVTQSIMF